MSKSIIISYVHQRLLSQANKDGEISREKFKHILGRDYHIKKEHRCRVLEELKRCNIILSSEKNKIVLKKID